MKHTSRGFLVRAGVYALAFSPGMMLAEGASPGDMNVIVILADDLGWSDCTLYGTTDLYQTPNIERLGIADKTAIIFISDNGGNIHIGLREKTVDGHDYIAAPTNNAPLRGGKASMFEGGVRVPCIVVWPGMTTAGSRTDAMIQTTDLYPTIQLLNTNKEPKIKGRKFVSLFNGSDLQGWTTQQGTMKFEVIDGVIVRTCSEVPSTFLCTEKV